MTYKLLFLLPFSVILLSCYTVPRYNTVYVNDNNVDIIIDYSYYPYNHYSHYYPYYSHYYPYYYYPHKSSHHNVKRYHKPRVKRAKNPMIHPTKRLNRDKSTKYKKSRGKSTKYKKSRIKK